MTQTLNKEYHDEWEVPFHSMEPCDIDDEACKKRHQDKVLEEYCDYHPSAPECKVFDE